MVFHRRKRLRIGAGNENKAVLLEEYGLVVINSHARPYAVGAHTLYKGVGGNSLKALPVLHISDAAGVYFVYYVGVSFFICAVSAAPQPVSAFDCKIHCGRFAAYRHRLALGYNLCKLPVQHPGENKSAGY